MGLRTELQIRLPNSPGTLASLCRTLRDERINIVAMMLQNDGRLRLVVDNQVRAVAVLREAHHHVVETAVVTTEVPDEPGGIAPVLILLADAGVNVEYAYSGSARAGRAVVVIGATDAMRAAAVAGV